MAHNLAGDELTYYLTVEEYGPERWPRGPSGDTAGALQPDYTRVVPCWGYFFNGAFSLLG